MNFREREDRRGNIQTQLREREDREDRREERRQDREDRREDRRQDREDSSNALLYFYEVNIHCVNSLNVFL